jgi:glutaminyl-tRNA synthetase
VRLRYGYFFTCDEVVTDADGEPVEVRGRIDPETRGGTAPDGRSPAGTIHWVSATEGRLFEAREYDRLFDVPNPRGGDEPFTEHVNPDSLVVRQGVIEPSVAERYADGDTETRYQFERIGYFWPDPEDATADDLVFNQIVPLRDTWAEDDGQTEEELEQKRREKERRRERQRQRSMEAQRDPVETLDADQRPRFERYRDALGLERDDAAVLAGTDRLAAFFEAVLADGYDAPQPVANWIRNELLGRLDGREPQALPFGAAEFGTLVRLVDGDAISNRAAGEVFEEMMAGGGDPEAIVERRGLRQIDDAGELETVVASVVEAHPDETERYRAGKKELIGFFMGQVMQETRGKAKPELARALLQQKLEGNRA